jgi:hypothetical protein
VISLLGATCANHQRKTHRELAQRTLCQQPRTSIFSFWKTRLLHDRHVFAVKRQRGSARAQHSQSMQSFRLIKIAKRKTKAQELQGSARYTVWSTVRYAIRGVIFSEEGLQELSLSLLLCIVRNGLVRRSAFDERRRNREASEMQHDVHNAVNKQRHSKHVVGPPNPITVGQRTA